MLSSQAPSRISVAFADGGIKNTIPIESQIGITPGAASFSDGFPPETFLPRSAGGIPPAGADFNGIFNAVTDILRWQAAGGLFKFDANFALAIGGYPKGAVLLKADGTGTVISLTESNSTNPDSGGAGWAPHGGGKKVDGGAGVGGTPVIFDTVFTEIPGVSVTTLNAYVVGISEISENGFTAIVRDIDGNPAALGFRWTAVGA